MRRALLAILFCCADRNWGGTVHPVILNEAKDLSKTLLVTLVMLEYTTDSIVRSLAMLEMTQLHV
jgi:hypothetical protein